MSNETPLLFRCVCCLEAQPEGEAIYDPDLDGPVCQICYATGKDAKVYLAKAGIRPVIHSSTINGRMK